MSGPAKALVLMGSPKAGRGNSESLGTYLLARLAERGVQTQMLSVIRALRSPEATQALLDAADGADLLILATPLYVDSLPSGVIRAMELLAARRRPAAQARPARFAAVMNCGFPEAGHNDTALAICKRFAAEAGFEWAGGLSMGMGEAIGGRPLEKAGRMLRKVRTALDMAAATLAEGQPVPAEAARVMAKPLLPSWLCMFIGNLRWKRVAKKQGAGRLDARPHEG
jgi:NAD(P)H-dependent FMN reductase